LGELPEERKLAAALTEEVAWEYKVDSKENELVSP
jgi:hypothetical protein